MAPTSPVELADKFSRKRAWLAAAAALTFMLNVAGRVWMDRLGDVPTTGLDWWLIHAVVMLLIVATGGGLLIRPGVRALMNDEVTKSHFATGMITGFWVAMVMAIGIYVLPSLRDLPGDMIIRVVVSTSVSVALFVFAWLEIRAHRDA
jgi:hypothetical protein